MEMQFENEMSIWEKHREDYTKRKHIIRVMQSAKTPMECMET
jgi:hypothetical protein